MDHKYWIRNEKLHALGGIIDDIAMGRQVDEELFEFAKRVIKELHKNNDHQLEYFAEDIHHVLMTAEDLNDQLIELAYIHKEISEDGAR